MWRFFPRDEGSGYRVHEGSGNPRPFFKGGCSGWVSHLGDGSSASGLGCTLSAPRAPASASKHRCQASTSEHCATATPGPPPSSSYARTSGQRPGPDPLPQLPFTRHSTQAPPPSPGCIGQLSRPARAGEGDARLEAGHAGGAALGADVSSARASRQASSCLTIAAPQAELLCSPRAGATVFR